MRPARASSIVCVLAITLATSAAWGQVTCGSNITEKVAMTMDITGCAMDPAVTVSGGTLDMAGHRIEACSGCTGVLLATQGSKLLNGSVIASGIGSIGVELGGSGVHKVENVTVLDGENGFESTSDKNKVKNCAAIGATSAGFRVTSAAKNAFSRCHASGGATGFFVTGDNGNLTECTTAGNTTGYDVNGNANKLSRNISTGTSGTGLDVAGNGNKLKDNVVTGAGSTGIIIAGNDNKVSKTSAIDGSSGGMAVSGNDNKLSKNAANDNSGDGLSVTGNGNNVNGCTASNNAGDGILINTGGANSLKSNVTMGNGGAGVHLVSGAINGSVSKTAALENNSPTGPDLQDDNASCDGNEWAKNIFNTSDANGVPAPGCIE